MVLEESLCHKLVGVFTVACEEERLKRLGQALVMGDVSVALVVKMRKDILEEMAALPESETEKRKAKAIKQVLIIIY